MLNKTVGSNAQGTIASGNGAMWLGLTLVIIFIVTSASMPWWGSRWSIQLLTEFLYTLALAQAWNLLAGYGGLVSVGQQVFVGIGAYMLVELSVNHGFNPFWVIPLAGIVCAVLSVPAAGILFRLRGANFAVGTWVAAEVVRLVVSNSNFLYGGSGTSIAMGLMGMSYWLRTSLGLWVAIVLGAGGTLAIYLLLRTRFGLALTAVRDNDRAAGSIGIRVGRVKWLVYILASMWAGLCGALIFITELRVSPDAAFSIHWTTTIFFVVVIGGLGTIEGPIVGSIVYFALRGFLANFGSWYLIALGSIAVIFMVFWPRGLWGLIRQWVSISVFPVQRRLGR